MTTVKKKSGIESIYNLYVKEPVIMVILSPISYLFHLNKFLFGRVGVQEDECYFFPFLFKLFSTLTADHWITLRGCHRR